MCLGDLRTCNGTLSILRFFYTVKAWSNEAAEELFKFVCARMNRLEAQSQ